MRSAVASALRGDEEATRALIEEGQKRIMEEDHIHWAPLKPVVGKPRRGQPLWILPACIARRAGLCLGIHESIR